MSALPQEADDLVQLAPVSEPIYSDLATVLQLPRRSVVATNPTGFYATTAKPALDRSFAGLLLLMLSPLLLFVAMMVRVALGPGVIFRQERVGLGGSIFTILKFRTMKHGKMVDETVPEEDRWNDYKSESDPRHTPTGRWLRAMSLDELPQLVNVVRGEMSLVGPRPELVELVELDDLWHHPRHAVRPGLTGPWQLSPERGNRLRDGLHYDVAYIETMSAGQDLDLLVKTAKSVPARLGR